MFNVIPFWYNAGCTADELSRSTLLSINIGEITIKAESFVGAILVSLPASDKRLEDIQAELQKDDVMKTVMHHTLNQWPDKRNISRTLRPHYNERSFFSVIDSLLLKGSRLVVSAAFSYNVLRYFHFGHQGKSTNRENAGNSVWWPGLCTDIDKMVKTCIECAKSCRGHVEFKLCRSQLEFDHKLQQIFFFHLNGKDNLFTIDHYSRAIEGSKVPEQTLPRLLSYSKVYSLSMG